VLTGGAEKKLRIWDLEHAPRDGSEASQTDGVDELKADGSNTAHEGTIKSACWDEKRESVISMGEDKVVR
jgi:serine-threonine kinase receptor-associated protein